MPLARDTVLTWRECESGRGRLQEFPNGPSDATFLEWVTGRVAAIPHRTAPPRHFCTEMISAYLNASSTMNVIL